MNLSVDESAEKTAAEGDLSDSSEQEPKPQFTLQISADSMTAYLRIKPAYLGQKISTKA